MFQIKLTLRQHTPIIHFQHDQEGATLRATELKPKLDRFIIKKEGEIKECRKLHNSWFASKDHDALSYKLQIKPVNQKKIFFDKSVNPLYFGNMGDATEKHYSSADSVDIIIFSFHEDLIDYLTEALICKFFFLHNFSTRQTKGFGSFYPIKYQGDNVKIPPDSLMPPNSYWLEINSTDDYVIYSTIDFFWKWLKSGINYKDLYKDSILKMYIAEKTDYRWEKKKIKEYFLGVPPDNDQKFFVRAFLGLADNFTYKWIAPNKRGNVEKYTMVDLDINVKSLNENVDRFRSPFIFKPIKQGHKTSIYIHLESQGLVQLLNKKFKLTPSITDSIKLEMGYEEGNSYPTRKTIDRHTSVKDRDLIINNAAAYAEKCRHKDDYKKLKDKIEKAKDLIRFFDSSLSSTVNQTREIETHNMLFPIEGLLQFAKTKMKDSFEVKNFSNQHVTNVKFLTNAR